MKTGPGPMEDPLKLRELAAWYREFAEKTGNPAIWEARLRMAEDLEQEAGRLEKRQAAVLEAPEPLVADAENRLLLRQAG